MRITLGIYWSRGRYGVMDDFGYLVDCAPFSIQVYRGTNWHDYERVARMTPRQLQMIHTLERSYTTLLQIEHWRKAALSGPWGVSSAYLAIKMYNTIQQRSLGAAAQYKPGLRLVCKLLGIECDAKSIYKFLDGE